MQSISNTQRNAIAFLAPKKFGNKFLREPEICLPNFSVHAQEHAPGFSARRFLTFVILYFLIMQTGFQLCFAFLSPSTPKSCSLFIYLYLPASAFASSLRR